MTASDCHPLAEQFLQENLRLNRLGPMKYRHGHWNAPAPGLEFSAPRCVVAGRYDLVIGSDLLYERDVHGTLAGFIASHATPGAQVWIVDPDRGNRPAFHRHMAAHGFELRHELRLQSASPGLPVYRGRMLTYGRGQLVPAVGLPSAEAGLRTLRARK